MSGWRDHLLVLPIVLPLATAAALMLIDERRHWIKAGLSLAALAALAATAFTLLRGADGAFAAAAVYRLGDWPVPFAIVLVLDRFAALMLMLSALLGLTTGVYALARWHTAGPHFHSLFQILLMGVNGAFLAGDLFNLFVFFEVLLAASYGLLLHGSGPARVKAGLHYIAINLAASLLFLIGVSLIYGVTGSLNMADVAQRLARLDPADRALAEAGAAVLGIAFMVKAGMWPLCFWLPASYSVAAAPVAAMFAILSKVGVYVLVRLWLLFFGEAGGASGGFGGIGLFLAGGATLIFGAIGVLASQNLRHLAGFAVLISSGTVLLVVPAARAEVTGAALFYLLSSTLALAALFLLIELVERGMAPAADMLAVTREAYGEDEEDEDAPNDPEVGIAVPATAGILGLCFAACAVVLAGLPPLSGFLGKFALLSALFATESSERVATATWIVLALLIASGLMTLIAMVRAGLRTFWTPEDWSVPRVRVIEMTPVVVLLLGCAALTVQAEPAMRYMMAAASALHAPADYVATVLPDAAAGRGAAR